MSEFMESPDQEDPVAQVQHLTEAELVALRGEIPANKLELDRLIHEQVNARTMMEKAALEVVAAPHLEADPLVDPKKLEIDRLIAEETKVMKAKKEKKD